MNTNQNKAPWVDILIEGRIPEVIRFFEGPESLQLQVARAVEVRRKKAIGNIGWGVGMIALGIVGGACAWWGGHPRRVAFC